jgi:hypothetical protein
LLDRKNPELLILVTSFLKKLACYSINKEEMKVLNAADKLAPLLTIDNPGHFCEQSVIPPSGILHNAFLLNGILPKAILINNILRNVVLRKLCC